MTPPKRRKPKSPFNKPPSAAVKKAVKLLRDWANRQVEVELITFFAGGSITHLGRITELFAETSAAEQFSTFTFKSYAGVRAMLLPFSFPKTTVETTTL